MRDALKPQASALDFVRNSRGANRLTRPIDLVRNWTYVTDLSLQRDHLVWREAERIRVGDWWLLDGAVARRAIVTRQNAEKKGRGILDEFLRLCDARDKAILDYAQTWGVLELCSHNLPARHEFSMHVPLRLPAPLAVPSSSDALNPCNLRACLPTRKEPLSTWRFFSAQCKALLNIAGELQRARPGREADWNNLLRPGIHPGPTLGAEKLCLRDAVEGWLQLGHVKPTVDDFTGALTWTGADLFGELAVQVALAVNAMDGQTFCIACGKPYQPRRRVIRRGFNYCPDPKCQRQAAAQRAQRYRSRKGSSAAERYRTLPYRGAFQGRTNDPLFSE